MAKPEATGEKWLYTLHWVDISHQVLVAETSTGVVVDRIELQPMPADAPFELWSLAWDSVTDSFFTLMNGADQTVRFDTIVRFDPEGKILNTFPHPAPPPSALHSNNGLTVSVERRTLLATTSSSPERPLDSVVEFSFDGTLTGHVIPRWDGAEIPDASSQLVSELGFYQSGILAVGEDLILPNLGLLVRIRAFPGEGVEPAEFLRGDSNVDGGVDLSDAIHTLNSLFVGNA